MYSPPGDVVAMVTCWVSLEDTQTINPVSMSNILVHGVGLCPARVTLLWTPRVVTPKVSSLWPIVLGSSSHPGKVAEVLMLHWTPTPSGGLTQPHRYTNRTELTFVCHSKHKGGCFTSSWVGGRGGSGDVCCVCVQGR